MRCADHEKSVDDSWKPAKEGEDEEKLPIRTVKKTARGGGTMQRKKSTPAT
jgi:hypothetical protein